MFNFWFFLLVFPTVFITEHTGFLETMEEFTMGFLDEPHRFKIIFWCTIFLIINIINAFNIYFGYKMVRKNGTR